MLQNIQTTSKNTQPISWCWTLKKSSLNLSWKLLQKQRRTRESQCMTHMLRINLLSGPKQSPTPYNFAAYLCLAHKRNGRQVIPVMYLPISKVTVDSFADCIVIASQAREGNDNSSQDRFHNAINFVKPWKPW